mgnify:CR=1 FL=1
MPATETLKEAKRVMQICNACRYCEGYCAVFPAMNKRLTFSDGDVTYLANLCHGCQGCYYACQYAPPHEFAVNIPQTFARLRALCRELMRGFVDPDFHYSCVAVTKSFRRSAHRDEHDQTHRTRRIRRARPARATRQSPW